MKILHPGSLLATVDAFDDAVMRGLQWEDEAEVLVAWTARRFNQPGAYAGTFALTPADWSRECRTYSGESLTSRVGRAHTAAEDALRMLTLTRARTGVDCDARSRATERLRARIFAPGSTTPADGLYCCGPCSLAFWRALAAGAYGSDRTPLLAALATLAASRDGTGGWGRFPFYYTLLLLAELPPELARAELNYCRPHAVHLLSRPPRIPGRRAERRRALLRRVVAPLSPASALLAWSEDPFCP